MLLEMQRKLLETNKLIEEKQKYILEYHQKFFNQNILPIKSDASNEQDQNN